MSILLNKREKLDRNQVNDLIFILLIEGKFGQKKEGLTVRTFFLIKEERVNYDTLLIKLGWGTNKSRFQCGYYGTISFENSSNYLQTNREKCDLQLSILASWDGYYAVRNEFTKNGAEIRENCDANEFSVWFISSYLPN